MFTHDLDFGALLAVTHAYKPSVIQFRTEDVLPQYLESHVVAILKDYQSQLDNGALIVVEERKNRVRILPLAR